MSKRHLNYDVAEPSYNYKRPRVETPAVLPASNPAPAPFPAPNVLREHLYAKSDASGPLLDGIEDLNLPPSQEEPVATPGSSTSPDPIILPRSIEEELRDVKAENDCFRKVFRFRDCIDLITGRVQRVREWSDETINWSLHILFHCGRTGYQFLLEQGFPLPSISTLQRALRNLVVKPGICPHPFELLSLNIEAMKKEENDANGDEEEGGEDPSGMVEAVLGLDECSIKQLLEFDTTFKTISGYTTVPQHSDPLPGMC